VTQLTGPTDPVLTLPEEETGSARTASSARLRFADFSVMTKPRITFMVVVTAWIGYEMALGTPTVSASFSWGVLAATLVGTALSCMGASVLNQVLERDTDALMERTKDRPLPAGRISMPAALALGLTLSLVGVAALAVFVNLLTAALSAFTIINYALVYTPLKRISSVCTIVGAVPGALPPVMGYAAAANSVGVEAWAMFAILFLWQLPHFLAIAWLYKEDYARAGLPMLPVVDPDGRATARQILLGCLALLPVGLWPTTLGMSGRVYFAGALIAGLVFLAFGVALIIGQTRKHARALFFASLIYLPLVYALMVIDRV